MSQDASARQDMCAHVAALSRPSAALAPSSLCLDSLRATAARQVIIEGSTCGPIVRDPYCANRGQLAARRATTTPRCAQVFTARRVRPRRPCARRAASIRRAAGRPCRTAPPAPLALSATTAVILSQLDPAAQVWHSKNQSIKKKKKKATQMYFPSLSRLPSYLPLPVNVS